MASIGFMAVADNDKTAFTVGPLGFYECEHISIGLCNAPEGSLMQPCMGDLHVNQCLMYLDDVIIFSNL